MTQIKKKKDFFNLDIVQLKNLLDKTEAKKSYFIFAVFLSLFGALFEGISIGLLMPTLKGIIGMDFRFVKEFPIFGNFISSFPKLFIYYNSAIFIILIALILVAVLLKNMLYYSSSICFARQNAMISHNLRKLIFHRYLSFGKLFFDKANKGHLQNVLNYFTQRITDNLMNLFRALTHSFMLCVYLVIMFTISWKLTILVSMLFPLLYFSSSWIIKKIKRTSYRYSDCRNKLNRHAFNVLSCIPLVKAYSTQKKEKARFNGFSELFSKLEFSQIKKKELIFPLQEMILVIFILFLMSVMAYFIVKTKTAGIANFLVFFYALRRSSAMFGYLNNARGSLAEINGPLSEVMDILDNKDKPFVAEGNKEFKGLRKNIEFNNLYFSYLKRVPVLKNITFSIEKGKLTAIVGPTGSGKTTIINLIMRFYDVAPSSIKIDGVDIKEYTLKSLRSHIAVVSQDPLLFNDTIRANLVYGLQRAISDEELIDILKKARLYDYVMRLPDDLNTLIGDRGVKLSGGEKQRLSIARALLKGSGILILDEATSSLDTKTEKLVQEAIDACIKNKTSIVIAHRLSTIKHADKIVVIEKGKLVEQGSLKQLLKKKRLFYQYWKEQKFD